MVVFDWALRASLDPLVPKASLLRTRRFAILIGGRDNYPDTLTFERWHRRDPDPAPGAQSRNQSASLVSHASSDETSGKGKSLVRSRQEARRSERA